MSKISIVAGTSEPSISSRPTEVFEISRIDFLAQLSQRLLSDPVAKKMPDIASFGYWCRRANLMRLSHLYHGRMGLRMGIGLTFHICPANVPVNFAFSMAFGLLSGNTCVMRLPSKPSKSADILIDAIRMQLTSSTMESIRQGLMLIKYEYDEEVSSFWSSVADGRIIWGGDETVLYMRNFIGKPRAREVSFADRFSLCAITPESILQMSEQELENICNELCNDIYLMGQAACSSPQLFVWIGAPESASRAKERLWPSLIKKANKKYPLKSINVMDKFVNVCRSAITNTNIRNIKLEDNTLYRLELKEVNPNQDKQRGYFGTIHEITIPDLQSLVPIINERYQTLTTVGIDNAAIRCLIIENGLTGIDRVVPIGQALNMDIVWDGYDIIDSLSRLINV